PLHERQRADAVAGDRRGLEIERLGGGLHFAGEALLHALAAPGKESLRLFEEPCIVRAPDAADAGRAAPLDLVEQAGAGAVGEDAVAARPQEKCLLQRDQRTVDRARRGKRPEIRAALVARAPELG